MTLKMDKSIYDSYGNIIEEIFKNKSVWTRSDTNIYIQKALHSKNEKLRTLFNAYEQRENERLETVRLFLRLRNIGMPLIYGCYTDLLYMFVIMGSKQLKSLQRFLTPSNYKHFLKLKDLEIRRRWEADYCYKEDTTDDCNLKVLAIQTIIDCLYDNNGQYLGADAIEKYIPYNKFIDDQESKNKLLQLIQDNENHVLQHFNMTHTNMYHWKEPIQKGVKWSIKKFDDIKTSLREISAPIPLHFQSFTCETGHSLSACVIIDEKDDFILYPIIKKGIHDDIIDWPFKQNIELKILKKNNKSVKKIIHKSNLDSTYFDKPVTAYNPICPKIFISIPVKELERNRDQYFNNNTLSIELKVL